MRQVTEESLIEALNVFWPGSRMQVTINDSYRNITVLYRNEGLEQMTFGIGSPLDIAMIRLTDAVRAIGSDLL